MLLREEEELVHGPEEGGVGVEAEDAFVAGLVEGEEFCQALRPGWVGVCGCAEDVDGFCQGFVMGAGLVEERRDGGCCCG